MIVKSKDIRFCLDKAAEITEQYRLYVKGAEDFARSVDDVLWICEEYLNHKIEIWELDIKAGSSSIRALYLDVTDHYEIYLLYGMNYCWRRFVLCKELFHVILNTEEYRNTEIYDHLTEVVLTFPEPNSKPGSPVVSELMAEIAAMEFLFPYSRRVLEREKAAGKQIECLAIAEYYKVPQYYVEKYLADPWMEYLGAFVPKAKS